MSSPRQALINKLVGRRTDLLPLLILDERVTNRIYANQLVRQPRVLFSSFSQSPRSRRGEKASENLNQKSIHHVQINESAILIRQFVFAVAPSPILLPLAREWELTKEKHQGCQLGMASAGSARQLFFLFALFLSQEDDDRVLVCLQGTTTSPPALWLSFLRSRHTDVSPFMLH